MLRHCLALAAVIALATPALAVDYRVEPLKTPPPTAELPKEIAAQLGDSGLRVIRGSSTTYCDIWLTQTWPVKENFQPTSELLYPFQPGQLIGVVRFARKASDFRDQDISTGLYTLRYSQQPVDGAHVGTSPTRDFLLLLKADADTSPEPLEYRPLVKQSAAAAGSSHPAMLSMQRAAEDGEVPSMRYDEDREWWILRFQNKAKAGDAAMDLTVELVVVGHAAE
jgi:hypothetical protein